MSEPLETRDDVDVLIVGSGPVGCAYARVLRDAAPGASILQIEAGPAISTPAGRHVKTIADPDERRAAQVASQGPDQADHLAGASSHARTSDDAPIVARPGTFLLGDGSRVDGEDGLPAAAMSANVGGMGAHWTCACPPPAFDERIPFIADAEFDELFAEASRLLHVSQSAFDGTPLGAEIRGVLGAAVDAGRRADRRVQPMPLAITVDPDGRRYWTGTDVILGDLAGGAEAGYELRPETLALEVLHDDEAVSAVRVRDLRTGEAYLVRARYVVVAGDALRTPQLLHASGYRLPALGRYLNEHAQVIGIAQLDEQFIPAADRTRPAPGTVAPQSGVSWIPYHGERFPFHGQIMQLDASPVPVVGVPEPWPGSVVGIGFFCRKEISPEDRVEFDDDRTDPFGLPAMTIHYRLSEADRETVAEAGRLIAGLGESIGGLIGGRPPIVMPGGSSMHYMGTVRMGPVDDGTSVCDADSRVWGTRNLFVGGNGVIPTATAGNPTATSVALAIRGARTIARELVPTVQEAVDAR
jgi:choline dehydrogenase-like flavoprotein